MKSLVLKLLMAVVMFSVANASDLKVIDFQEAKKLFENNSALFLDARSDKLYKRGTILGSLNFPVSSFDKNKNFLPKDTKAKIVSFCNGIKCEHSDELAHLLQKDGYTNVVVYKGGYPEWKDKQMPQMALKVETQKSNEPQEKGEKYQAKGATIYLGQDKGMIDQYWFEKVVLEDLPKNVVLVDVRKEEVFKEGHIKGAINAPWDADNQTVDLSNVPNDKLLVFYCNTGMSSAEAALSFKDRIGKDIFYFDANINCENNDCEVEANEDL